MMMEDDWTIRPREGLGRLRFGMSPEEVEALSDTYGAVTGRGSSRVSEALLHDTLETFGGALTEDEKRDFISAYAKFGPPAGRVTEARGEPGLVLHYQADRLVEIMPAIGQRPIFLSGVDVFSLPAREALAVFEGLNGGPGRFADTEAAFDGLAISLVGFCVTEAPHGVRLLDPANEVFMERTVTVLSEPYRPEGCLGTFISHSVLESSQ